MLQRALYCVVPMNNRTCDNQGALPGVAARGTDCSLRARRAAARRMSAASGNEEGLMRSLWVRRSERDSVQLHVRPRPLTGGLARRGRPWLTLAVLTTLVALLAGAWVALSPSARAGASTSSMSSSSAARFTSQLRLGYAAGDDWEPALAADRYGHVYALYKHYDVSGQSSCASCDLHVLLQVSSDRGRTWSTPRALNPEPTNGGQFDSQIVVDPVDG